MRYNKQDAIFVLKTFRRCCIMKENVVSCLRLPANVNIEKLITCPQYGEVAAVLNWNGIPITFFRTDFLQFERVAWYCAEKFGNTAYHEELPKEVTRSIAAKSGIFLSRNFIIPADVVYEEARRTVETLSVPGLKSTLMYGVIYDVLGKWLLETGTLSKDEWLNSPKDKGSQQLILTRDCGGWTLEELLGDVFQLEWTQERYGNHYVVARAGQPATDGEANYPARMRYAYDESLGVGAKARIFFF